MLPEYLLKIVEKIAKNEGFSDYNIDVNSGSNHGDNFIGVMTTIKIIGIKEKNGLAEKSELNLICKTPPANEIRRENFKTGPLFDRELYIYSTLLPAFVQFQQEKGLSESESFLSFPKVYACEMDIENETCVLVMEDLRPKNFEMFPKDQAIDLNHELLVMRELGKLHAISFAMKDQGRKEFEKFKQLRDTFSDLFIHGKLMPYMARALDKAAEVIKNPEHKKLMQDFRHTFIETYDEYLFGESSNEFAIIAHGDCWNNNFLFEYTGSEKIEPKSICFVDWQISRYCPPVLDLLYNIFSSTDTSFRDQHYEKLLQTYYSSLSDTIRKLGSDPDKLYTYENFENQLRKFGRYALLCAPLIIGITVAGPNDVSNLDEYAELLNTDENIDVLKPFEGDTKIKYSRLINDLVTDLVNYGYLGKN